MQPWTSGLLLALKGGDAARCRSPQSLHKWDCAAQKNPLELMFSTFHQVPVVSANIPSKHHYGPSICQCHVVHVSKIWYVPFRFRIIHVPLWRGCFVFAYAVSYILEDELFQVSKEKCDNN